MASGQDEPRNGKVSFTTKLKDTAHKIADKLTLHSSKGSATDAASSAPSSAPEGTPNAAGTGDLRSLHQAPSARTLVEAPPERGDDGEVALPVQEAASSVSQSQDIDLVPDNTDDISGKGEKTAADNASPTGATFAGAGLAAPIEGLVHGVLNPVEVGVATEGASERVGVTPPSEPGLEIGAKGLSLEPTVSENEPLDEGQAYSAAEPSSDSAAQAIQDWAAAGRRDSVAGSAQGEYDGDQRKGPGAVPAGGDAVAGTAAGTAGVMQGMVDSMGTHGPGELPQGSAGQEVASDDTSEAARVGTASFLSSAGATLSAGAAMAGSALTSGAQYAKEAVVGGPSAGGGSGGTGAETPVSTVPKDEVAATGGAPFGGGPLPGSEHPMQGDVEERTMGPEGSKAAGGGTGGIAGYVASIFSSKPAE